MRSEYESRLASRQSAAAQHERTFRRIGTARLVIVALGALLAWWNMWLLPLPVAAFVLLIIYHERIARSAALERRAVEYYRRGIDRLDFKWAGEGESGEQFRGSEHPYAEDLDLFGHGSMFQLLNAARTHAGELTLAEWLKYPAERSEVEARQEAISELRSHLDLREDLALLGQDIRVALHPEPLVRWGQHAPERISPVLRVIASLFTAGVLVLFTGSLFQLWGWRPLVLLLLAQGAYALLLRDRVVRIHGAVQSPARDLAVLAELLARLEREPFHSAKMAALKQRLVTEGLPASRQIARLRRLIEWHDSGRNQMFALIAKALLWSTHFAFAIEKLRQVSGARAGVWLDAVGEIEALSSLAGYAAENPDDPFPDVSGEAPLFAAEGLAHPLIHSKSSVRNDVHLDSDMRLLLVSGSNMSGKSTLLRSVGLNAALAWAGAPVRAHSLRLSRLSIGACIRVQDSIQDGKSRFYAEITRLRQIVGMLEESGPLLFLLDELLSGTNSHDRRIGAEAIVRTLVNGVAIGLVTTHDLALAHVADTLAPHARNVHFEDHIEDGRIAFDYKMRAGVVEKSNALKLMRSVGLQV